MRSVGSGVVSARFDQGYCLHGFGRESLKLSGLKLRKIVLANGASYWLRPSLLSSGDTILNFSELGPAKN